ncbi:MAG: Rid family detoxifying hydrolase [bacterium]
METIRTSDAPEAVGTYSQGRVVNGMIFTSGQIAIDPETGQLVSADFPSEAEQVLDNLLSVVRAGGGDRDSIVKTSVFLTDLSLYDSLNEVYRSYFEDSLPARSVVEVQSLPKDVHLEIEAVASAIR